MTSFYDPDDANNKNNKGLLERSRDVPLLHAPNVGEKQSYFTKQLFSHIRWARSPEHCFNPQQARKRPIEEMRHNQIAQEALEVLADKKFREKNLRLAETQPERDIEAMVQNIYARIDTQQLRGITVKPPNPIIYIVDDEKEHADAIMIQDRYPGMRGYNANGNATAIVVTTGFIKKASALEKEGVLSHEIGHLLRTFNPGDYAPLNKNAVDSYFNAHGINPDKESKYSEFDGDNWSRLLNGNNPRGMIAFLERQGTEEENRLRNMVRDEIEKQIKEGRHLTPQEKKEIELDIRDTQELMRDPFSMDLHTTHALRITAMCQAQERDATHHAKLVETPIPHHPSPRHGGLQ